MTKAIRLRNIQDMENISAIVSKYPYDIWIHGKSGMADAKSILGMFVLKLDEPLTLVIPSHAEGDELLDQLLEELKEFFV